MLTIASRPGTCALCRQPIVSGELIQPDDDRDAWVHARCEQSHPPARHRQHPRVAPRTRVDVGDATTRARRGEARKTAADESGRP